MRTKKRSNVPNPVAKGFPPTYEPAFKKLVILYAEKKGNQEAHKRYGITEETIRRWRRIRDEIMEQAEHPVRRSQRLGNDSCSESTSSKCDSDYNFLKEGLNESLSLDIDSMPLKQRLSQNLNESSVASMSGESPLQSLPLSPTKLKVTRQGSKGHQKSSEASEVCLKWNSYNSNMQSVFPNLLTKEQYVDATLVSEGQMLKCHKMILSSCSPYFEEILSSISPFQHPVLFMKDVPFWALKAMCDFMYAGEVHISQDKIQDLLAAAATFKIKGLGTPIDKGEPKQTSGIPQIKRETNDFPLLNKVVKTEKPDENILSKERLTRKKEDRRSFQDVFEESKAVQNTSKFALRKTAVAPKPILDTFQPKPASRLNYAERKVNSIRKRGRAPKIEASQDSNKVKDVPVLTKTNINDPLDLLQPVYEEVTKDVPLQLGRNSFGKLRTSTRKSRKRKLVDYVEDRVESPIFSLRKGTRSRPNVKIPKLFDSHYEETLKEATVATIVREPHTDQNDPLIGVDLEEIKAEPVDLDESAIEVEENMVNYIVQDHVMSSQEDEEIIGNFDSPLVNIKRRITPNMFKKHPPFIVDVRTVSESDVRLLDIQNENVEIVDIAKISNSKVEDEAIISNFDAGQSKTSQIVISNVQSMAENQSESTADDTEIGNNLGNIDLKNSTEKGGNKLERNDDPLLAVSSVDSLVSEADLTEEEVVKNEVSITEDQSEVVPEMENFSKDALLLETLKINDENTELTDDSQKIDEIPLQPLKICGNDQKIIGIRPLKEVLRSVEISDNDQELTAATPFKEVPLEPMEMSTKDGEITDATPKLEEIPLRPVEKRKLIDATSLEEIPIETMQMDTKDKETLNVTSNVQITDVDISGNNQKLIDPMPREELSLERMGRVTEDKEMSYATPELEEIPLRSVNISDNDQKLIDATQLKELSIEPMDTEDKEITDATSKLNKILLQSVKMDVNNQELVDATPLKEIPAETMEMVTKDQELIDDTLKLEVSPNKTDDKDQHLINNTQKLVDIKENGLENIPGIEIPPKTEELSPPVNRCSPPCLATTSTLINPIVPQKIDFFVNQDFRKDVQLEDLSRSKPNWSSFKDESEFLVVSEGEQFSVGQCGDDESRLEDSLLADLEDEMASKEGPGRTNDDPEQTLEMIVQDLNDSLYKMEK